MIHRTAPSWQTNAAKEHRLVITSDLSWQQHLQQAITEPAELLSYLELSPQYLDAAIKASQLFPLKAPKPFLQRIEKGNINDPLLKQILPIDEELLSVAGYSVDPVGEQADQPSGMIHKYHGRVLLIVNGHCAVNCRYCFRRHFPYDDNRLSRSEWDDAISQIATDDSISEVIYSGGDPLASNDKQLLWLTQQIAAIPHIKRLRIHTRLPVVIPNRITDASLEWMTNHRLATVVVLHMNHANELNDETLRHSIQMMKNAGITVLNQAVLLKGINDSVEDLAQLSEASFDAGVIPYYLHVLDKVDGSAHFGIADSEAKKLHQQLTHYLPGYLVPKLVREIANMPAKVAI